MTDTKITTAMAAKTVPEGAVNFNRTSVKTDETFLSNLTAGLTLTAEPTDLEFKLRALFTPNETREQFPIDARELHDFLEIGKDFSNWIKDGIKKYDFTEEIDYKTCSPNLASENHGGQNKIDYKTTWKEEDERKAAENNGNC